MNALGSVLALLAATALADDPSVAVHPADLCRRAGWILILLGFASGALLGLGFHREGFWGGYSSLRRRLARLGHIALVALGMLNLLYALAPLPESCGWRASAASFALVGGAVLMPTVCFLSAWKDGFRALFVLPVLCLSFAAILVIAGGAA